MNLIEVATALAIKAHEGQFRKEARTPYVVHPIAVALILSRHGFDDHVVSAGLLHDVLEDTSVTYDELVSAVGEEVASLVASVSHNAELPWEEKKKDYIESIRTAGDSVKAIATADKIANAQSLLFAYEKDGTSLWKNFNAGREKKLWFEHTMLAMLEDEWEHPLIHEYAQYVEKMDTLV